MSSSKLQTMAPHVPDGSKRRRAITLATLGNVMEWYDFVIYGFLAAAIGASFFPSADPTTSLLATFATFAIGFVARPVGALVLGPLSDRKGRKFVLLISMMLMATGSLMIGISPTYQQIGIAAPLIVVLARLFQGFSAGGEFGSSAVFLIEWASPKRRGFYGSFHQVASYGGLLVGVLVVTLLTTVLGSEQMQAWGWRIPFIAGSMLAIVVLYLRRRLEETPVYTDLVEAIGESPEILPATSAQTTRPAATKAFFLAIGVTALWTVTAYVTLSYMPTFAAVYGGITKQEALWSTTIGAFAVVVLLPIAGHLSDKFGRRPFIIGSAVSYVVLAVPVFALIVTGRSFISAVLGALVFAVPTAAIAGTGTATISELFKAKQRGTMVSIGGAIAIAVFGGFGPYISTLLISVTGMPISPAFYVSAVALITLIAGLALPDLSRDDLQP